MIFDHISELSIYAKNDKRLEAVIKFLEMNPAASLMDGRHDAEMGVFVNVSLNTVQDEGKFEVHRKYADLQLVIDGSERMEWSPLDALRDGTEYNT